MSAHVFTLPDLGEGLTEAEIVRWLVADGDEIQIDQPVVEVETAKAVVEVPSPHAGRVATRHAAEGATLDVGAPLLTVADLEEGSGNVLVGYGTKAGTATTGRRRRPRVAVAPVERVAAGAPPLVISPLVRRLARRAGVDLSALQGTGPGGVITRRDVESAVASAGVPGSAGGSGSAVAPALSGSTVASAGVSGAAVAPASGSGSAVASAGISGAAVAPASGSGPAVASASISGAALVSGSAPAVAAGSGSGERRVPLTGFRKAVSAVLSRSRAEIPEATVWVDVDATALWELRERTRGDAGSPGLLAYIARFVVAGLREYPVLNARIDTERQEIVELGQINLGVAVQTDRGLVVPAVMGAQTMTTSGLDAAIRDVTARARRNESTAAELSAGTFTLNNYGAFRVDGSAAIINHPQVAILGLGRIIDRPWVVDGALTVRKITQLSFVFDHRVCDGGTAAGFIRAVADAMEDPPSALARL